MDTVDDLVTLHDAAQRFAEQVLRRQLDGGEGAIRSHVDRDGWSRMVAMGWPSLLLPPEHGGFGLPLRYLAALVSAFARHGASHPLTVLAAEVPALLIGCGSQEQAQEHLASITEQGRLVVSALWDPDHPFEPSAITTSWRRDGGGYVLEGAKSPVPYAVLADAFVILARSVSSGEPALFVVQADTPGLEVTPLPTSTGAPTGFLLLAGVRATEGDRLATGDVQSAVTGAMDIGASITSAELTVAAMRGLELTVEYVKVRKQFDRALGEFQAVHHHCADMYRDVEAMRIVAAPVLQGRITDRPSQRDVSVAKAQTSTKCLAVLEMAHQLHGGVGFYADYPLELIYRRSIVLQGDYGSSRWHRARISRALKEDDHAMRGRADGI